MKVRWMLCAVVAAAGLLGLGAWAQAAGSKHVKIPVVPARAEDVSSPEALVLADYESISGGIGVPRQWGRDLSLFDPHAYFVAMSKDPNTGAVTKRSFSPQEYADQSEARLVKEGMTERELGHRTHRFGNVATVFSAYESKSALTGKSSRGVNVYQTYFDGKRWWILSIAWDEERPDNPIPPELLEKR